MGCCIFSTGLLNLGCRNCYVCMLFQGDFNFQARLLDQIFSGSQPNVRLLELMFLGCDALFHFHPQGCSKRLPGFFASTLCIIYSHNSSNEHFNFAPHQALALTPKKWRKTFSSEAFVLLRLSILTFTNQMHTCTTDLC